MRITRMAITMVAVAAIALCIAGCKKKTTTIDVAVATMTAGINGAPFAVKDPAQVTTSTSTSGGISYTYVYGTDSAGRVIELAIASGYKIDSVMPLGTGGSAAYYYSAGLSGPYTRATSGFLTIAAVTPSTLTGTAITGNFTFMGADSTNVVNGYFIAYLP